jgi:ribosomal protein S18 acetylase RimI-like enzyme
VPADAPALLALDAATWSPAVTPSPAPGRTKPFFAEGERPEDVLVAEVDGRIVGYVELRSPTHLESNGHVQQIRGIAVDPPAQRRGIGRALLDGAITEARRRGARRLTLRVLAPNAAARAAYEASGFEVEGVLRGEFLLDGRYVDDVLMALDLSRD